MLKTSVLAAGILLATDIRYAAADLIPERLGINIHFTDAQPGEIRMIQDAGFAMVRMDMSWSGIETTRGRYDFSRYDHLVRTLEEAGIGAVFILDYGNPLYDQKLSPYTDEGRAAYASFAAAVVKRYAGKGFLWEVWNEPNHPIFWKPQVKVEDYVKLAIVACKAIRQAAPEEKIIGPATSMIDLDFLETCFQGGLLQYFDAVSVHPYRGSDPETVADEYRKFRRLIDRHAPEGKQIPILSGEWGYSTATNPQLDQRRQGKYLARQWLVNLACDVPVSIWYDWCDDGTDPKDIEHHFGTVSHEYHAGTTPPYTPKPAYIAAQTLTRELKGYRFNKRLALDQEADWLLLFQNGDAVKLVAWTTQRQPHRVKLPIAQGTFALASHLGETHSPVTAGADGLEVELSDGPIYLTPDGNNPWLAILAKWSRLEDVVSFKAPGELQTSTTLHNTTPESIAVKSNESVVHVPAGKDQAFGQTYYVNRSPHFTKINSELAIDGYPTIRQSAWVGADNPLEAKITSASGGGISVFVDNPTGEATDTQLSLGGDITQPLAFAVGETRREMRLKANFGEAAYTIHPTMTSGAKLLLELPARRYLPIPLSAQELKAIPDGDPAVKSDVLLEQSVAPIDAPISGAPVLQLSYRFEEGLKFARISPTQPMAIVGQPLAIGFWINGDASNNLARLRYTDSAGQVFQPRSILLNFRDWKYFEFPLSAEGAGNFSGPHDGVVYYPISLDTFFLVDSAGRKATSGKIQVSSPVLIYQPQ